MVQPCHRGQGNSRTSASTRELAETDPGSNAVTIRTEAGAALFDEAVAAGRLVEEMSLDVDDLGRMQPHHVKKKLSGLARSRGLADAGSLAPRLFNMRADALDEALGAEVGNAEQRGAERRARVRRMSAD
jgi:coenzyme F420 hydrogenase subunit beta